MKVTKSLLIAAICSWTVAVVSAEYVEVASRSGAASVGYGLASVLWDHGRYPCTSMDDVTQGFWRDVQNVVFQECKDTYALWASDATLCADGAETFVFDKTDACVNTQEDCNLLGDTAAMEVSGVFCFPQAINRNKRHFFSRACRAFAKSLCQDLVIDYVEELIDNKQCEGKRWTSSEQSTLQSNCITVVDRLSETAAMPIQPLPSECNPCGTGHVDPCKDGRCDPEPEEDSKDDDPCKDDNDCDPDQNGGGGDNDGVVGGTWGGDDPKYEDAPYKPNDKDPKLYMFTP
jgi:hypothetical protein